MGEFLLCQASGDTEVAQRARRCRIGGVEVADFQAEALGYPGDVADAGANPLCFPGFDQGDIDADSRRELGTTRPVASRVRRNAAESKRPGGGKGTETSLQALASTVGGASHYQWDTGNTSSILPGLRAVLPNSGFVVESLLLLEPIIPPMIPPAMRATADARPTAGHILRDASAGGYHPGGGTGGGT